MKATAEVEIKIAEVKDWFESFNPSNEMEERFKSAVKEALENVTRDFKVMFWTPFEIRISVIKEWFEGLTPSNEREERLKNGLKEVLENASPHYCIVPDRPLVSYQGVVKELERYERCLLWAHMAAAGHDVIGLYFGLEYSSSRRPEHWDLSDITASVNRIMSENS